MVGVVSSVLVTQGSENGGVHPPEKLGPAYAAVVLEVLRAAFLDFDNGAGAADFTKEIEGIVTEAHRRVQAATRKGILEGRVYSDTWDEAEDATSRIVQTARRFPFANRLIGDGTLQADIFRELRIGLATTNETEHRWHAMRLAGRAHREHLDLFGAFTNPAAGIPRFIEMGA